MMKFRIWDKENKNFLYTDEYHILRICDNEWSVFKWSDKIGDFETIIDWNDEWQYIMQSFGVNKDGLDIYPGDITSYTRSVAENYDLDDDSDLPDRERVNRVISKENLEILNGSIFFTLGYSVDDYVHINNVKKIGNIFETEDYQNLIK